MYTVAALYRFTPVDAPALRAACKARFAELGLCGSLLVASEGINGTLAGSAESVDAMLDFLKTHAGLERAEVKFSTAPTKPFNRLKVRLKREIITFNQPQADVNTLKGDYVEPQDWNALISDPEIVVLDTRNSYETAIGIFEGAQDPNISTFTEFAAYVRAKLDPTKHKKIAMYCTGGIRCEKASAFMRAEGFEQVYHLKGGILKYLEVVSSDRSAWRGDCYVFDKRMAVGQGLRTGGFTMCYGCGAPLSEEGRAHEHFEEGVSCAACFSASSDADKARFRARQEQMEKESFAS
jgi:UPF0176 protein